MLYQWLIAFSGSITLITAAIAFYEFIKKQQSGGKVALIITCCTLVLTLALYWVDIPYIRGYSSRPNLTPITTSLPPEGTNAPSPTQTNPTPTPAPTSTSTSNPLQDSYTPYYRTLILNDPLNDNSEGHEWSEYTSNSNSCQFSEGAYLASATPHVAGFCYAAATNFGNFVFEAQITILQGDCGAILFRASNASNNFYYFQICQNGLYSVGTYNGLSRIWSNFINFLLSSSINQGLNQMNLVAVVTKVNSFELYVNHQKIGSVSDVTYSQGQIGTLVSAYYGDSTQVLFSNAKVWTLE